MGRPDAMAIDTETAKFRPGCMAPPLAVLSWSMGKESGLVRHQDVYDFAKDALEAASRGEVVIVGQNFAYDACVLAAHDERLLPWLFDAYQADGIEDTWLREALIDIAEGRLRGGWEGDAWVKRDYSLADIVRRRFKIELDKDTWRLRYGELREVPLDLWPEGAKRYAREDAEWTLKVHADQDRDVRHRPARLKDSPAQARASFALTLMSNWGIRTDGAAVEAFASGIRAEMGNLEAALSRDGLMVKGVKKKRPLQEKIDAAYRALGRKTPLTATGQVSTAAEVLEDLEDPALQPMIRYVSLEKTSGFVDAIRAGAEYPIHSVFNPLVDTGRTSSSRPNLQNLPRAPGVRECFVPRPGYVYADCDYSTLDLCTLGQACLWILKRSALADAINKKIDPHLVLGSKLLHVPYAEAVARKGDKDVKDKRQMAKAGNFGFPGGLGVASFRAYAKSNYNVILSESEATDLRREWFETWPEMEAYFNHINAVTSGGVGSVVHFVSGRERGLIGFCQAANTYFQGLEADGAKAALFDVARAEYVDRDSPLFGSRTVNFVHDEILAEVPEDRASEAADELSRIMVETMSRYVPDVRIKAEPALMRRWLKDAEEIRGEDGRLVCWEPKLKEKT